MNNNYTDLSNESHKLIIRNRKSNAIVVSKVFECQSNAINYLEESRLFKHNSKIFSYTLIGPNIYYSV